MFRSASFFYWHIFHSSGFHHICNIKCRLNCRYSPQNIFNAKNFNPHKKPISLLNVPICTQGMQRTWWPEAGTIIVTGPYYDWSLVLNIVFVFPIRMSNEDNFQYMILVCMTITTATSTVHAAVTAVTRTATVYPKKYAHGFVVLCFVVVMQSFIMNSHEVFIHIHQGCFAGTGAIVRLPQCQWSKPDGYGKISQCITTTKHSKAKTVCIFLGIYCTLMPYIYIKSLQLDWRLPKHRFDLRVMTS